MTEAILITGADRGLGLSLVGRFLNGGFHVFAGAYGGTSNLAPLLDRFPKTLSIIPLDVADMESIRGAVARVSERVPALDILINNAGINLDKGIATLEDLDLTNQHLEQTMAVNAFGPLRMVQQFMPLLTKGQRKLIVNISSEAGSITNSARETEFAYCMSKAAMNMQTRILNNYLHPQGFDVLALHPGWMRTDMGGPEAHIHPDEAAEGIFKLAARAVPTGDLIYLDYLARPLNW